MEKSSASFQQPENGMPLLPQAQNGFKAIRGLKKIFVSIKQNVSGKVLSTGLGKKSA